MRRMVVVWVGYDRDGVWRAALLAGHFHLVPLTMIMRGEYFSVSARQSPEIRAVQILRIDDFIENQIPNRKNYRNLMNFEQIPNLSAMRNHAVCRQICAHLLIFYKNGTQSRFSRIGL